MILSASRRTDIPAFHMGWFMNRLRDGRVMVRNPGFKGLVHDIDISPENVDAIIFLSKDPSPVTECLDEILEMGHKPFFQITITGAGRFMEPRVPDARKVAEAFRAISERVGKDRMVWRYDPLMLSDGISMEDHAERFSEICSLLEGYAGRCILGFFEPRLKLEEKMASGILREILPEEKREAVAVLSPIARSAGIELTSCCGDRELAGLGIRAVGCIDEGTMRSFGIPFERYAVPQRKGCTCVKTVDVGTYGTCFHDCIYCYANPPSSVRRASDPNSPMLADSLREGDEVVRIGKRRPRLSDF